jgi:hypothetical protein
LLPLIHTIECAIANCEKNSISYLPPISMNVGWKVPMMLLQNIEKKTLVPNNGAFCHALGIVGKPTMNRVH